MTVRNLGRRQLPLGLTISFVSAVLASVAGYFATDVESGLSAGILIVVAGLLITVAWVVSWMVIETAFVDWRPAGRQSHGVRAARAGHPGRRGPRLLNGAVTRGQFRAVRRST